ncbi:hypothetical protein WG907_07645 [Sphingobium sp. AN558]|uniref:hypothetical protein n=1 Tax=Sphingobium sp. AN558 TaxID=3133442 RepID=UPI0030BCF3FA
MESDLTILTIDFEASCLPRHGRSFPIEVGLAGPAMVRSWLIRPSDDWFGWDWTAEAEALHGLSRERIAREGQSVDMVLRELAALVDGFCVVADSVLDQYWLETLAIAARTTAPFAIDHVAQLLDERQIDEAGIMAAVAYADAHHPARHRAACDAQWLQAVVSHALRETPEAAPAPRLYMVESLC